ncbi:MAG: ROK family protein [Eubacteriales bacterium]|nr:ROK family protein [Eubacteriales bacterium]
MREPNSIANTAQVKSANLACIRYAMRALGCGTKNDAAQATGLSAATCNTLLNELAAAGELLETGDANPGGVGRPAKAYRFNAEYCHALCLYVTSIGGVRQLDYSVVNLLGEAVAHSTLTLPLMDFIEIEQVVRACIDNDPLIKCIGLGIPGVPVSGRAIRICDVEALRDCDAAGRLKAAFGLPVMMDNDMNLIAYGFYRSAAPAEPNSLAFVSFFEETCAGCGFIINGRIYRGSSNFAGELSYLPFRTRDEAEQLRMQDRGCMVDIVAKTLASLAAVINPSLVIFTGAPVKADMAADITARCKDFIPQEHIPAVEIYPEIDDYYRKGLSALTLELLQETYQ